MNWLNVYHNIIKKVLNRKLDSNIYYEKHHIIPKSIFNDKATKILNLYFIKSVKDKKNLVYLTAREHFFCHVLLIKNFENNKNCKIKMIYAFNFLANRLKIKTSRQYQNLRQEYSKILSERLKGKPSLARGKKWSKEAKQKKSENHYMRGKRYEDIWDKKTVEKLKNYKPFKKGRTVSKEIRKKLSERVFTKEWREKISKAATGRILSEKTKNNLRRIFGNSILNKNVDQHFYLFESIDGKKIIARKYDMKKMFRITVHKLVDGRLKSSKGLKFIREIYLPFGKNIKQILNQNKTLKEDFYNIFEDITDDVKEYVYDI